MSDNRNSPNSDVDLDREHLAAMNRKPYRRTQRCPNCSSKLDHRNVWIDAEGRCEWCTGKGDYFD